MITFADYLKSLILSCAAAELRVSCQSDKAYYLGDIYNHGGSHWQAQMPLEYVDKSGTITCVAGMPGAQVNWHGIVWTFSSVSSVTGATIWRDLTEVREPEAQEARYVLWDYADYLIVRHLDLFLKKRIGFKRLKEVYAQLSEP